MAPPNLGDARKDELCYEAEVAEIRSELRQLNLDGKAPHHELIHGLEMAKASLEEARCRRRLAVAHEEMPGAPVIKNLEEAWASRLAILNQVLKAVVAGPLPTSDVSRPRLVFDSSSASDQTADKKGKGPTALPSSFFDPTPDNRLYDALVPTPEELGQHKRSWPFSSSVVFKLDMHHDEEVKLQEQLSKVNLPTVVSTDSSKPDCLGGVTVHGVYVPLRVREYKASTVACSNALPQALALGTSVAVGLLHRGLPPAKIIVPVDVTNGRSIQFAAVYIAGGSVPLSWTLSPELDLWEPEHANMADGYLRKTQHLMGEMMQLVRSFPTTRIAGDTVISSINVPPSIHIKNGCLSHLVYPDDFDSSLAHVVSVLRVLSKAGLRKTLCYPMGFGLVRPGSFTTAKSDTWCAFFPNLAATGPENPGPPFQAFVPDGQLAGPFVDACEAAVRELHDSGVVHGDLYTSNIMHRVETDGVVHVKIIDMDTCFLLEDGVPDEWRLQWETRPKWQGRFQVDKDARELDLFMVRVMRWASSASSDQQPRKLWCSVACASSIAQSNVAFRKLQDMYIESCMDIELGHGA